MFYFYVAFISAWLYFSFSSALCIILYPVNWLLHIYLFLPKSSNTIHRLLIFSIFISSKVNQHDSQTFNIFNTFISYFRLLIWRHFFRLVEHPTNMLASKNSITTSLLSTLQVASIYCQVFLIHFVIASRSPYRLF